MGVAIEAADVPEARPLVGALPPHKPTASQEQEPGPGLQGRPGGAGVCAGHQDSARVPRRAELSRACLLGSPQGFGWLFRAAFDFSAPGHLSVGV